MYIPPTNSRLFLSGKSFNFDKLLSEATEYENTGSHIILMGDTNARIGDACDFIQNDDDLDENLPLPEDYIPDSNSIPVRTSSDQNVISGHVKHLLKFCKSTQFRVMNGRWEKCEDKGRLTCISAKGSSVVDYCLIKESSLEIINESKIGDVLTHSDHSALNLTLKTKLENVDKENENNEISEEDSIELDINQNIKDICESYNWRYVPENDSIQEKVKKCLDSENMKDELEKLKEKLINNKINVDDAISVLRQILIKISETSLKKI